MTSQSRCRRLIAFYTIESLKMYFISGFLQLFFLFDISIKKTHLKLVKSYIKFSRACYSFSFDHVFHIRPEEITDVKLSKWSICFFCSAEMNSRWTTKNLYSPLSKPLWRFNLATSTTATIRKGISAYDVSFG